MKHDPHTTARYVFFGSSEMSVSAVDELVQHGLTPATVVTMPDKPQGRKLKLTPNVVKTWALAHNIPVLELAKLDAAAREKLQAVNADVFIVASYGKIIPKAVLDIPKHGVLNIHPSLLPAYRGPSPLQSAILDDAKHTGVSLMLLDEEMDHGPIIAQEEIHVHEWPTYGEFENMMAREGAKLTARVLPKWLTGHIKAEPQKHAAATYTKKFVKEDGLINLMADPYLNFRKIQAFHEWPQAYFFARHNGDQIRVKITKATFKKGELHIEKVIPEGSREMAYKDFLGGYKPWK